MLSKHSIRKSLLRHRQAILPQHLNRKSLEIVHNLRQCEWFQSAQTIFAYRSFRQEISLQTLYENTSHHRWGFPRCVEREMIWHHWTGQPASDFAIGAYGIEEPQVSWPTLRTADLILVPMVACDRRGFRLGYGGGYYDRFLSASDRASTRTIGIVLDDFVLDQLPTDEWDQQLDAICTESGCFEISEI